MTTTTQTRCRTCPAILENYGGAGDTWDQCIRCSERSKAVRAAVASDPLPVMRVRKPKPRTCRIDGHHACEHHQAIVAFLVEWTDDMSMCPVCAAEVLPGAPDGASVSHKAKCALLAVIEPKASRGAPAAGREV